MSDSWTWGTNIFAELDVKRIYGAPGLGFYRLFVEVEAMVYGRDPGKRIVVSGIAGEVRIHGKGEKGEQIYHLGRLSLFEPRPPIVTYEKAHQERLSLEMELDGSRIEAIERVRCGGSLLFEVNLYGTAALTTGDFCSVNARLTYRANQSTWLEVLEQMGYRKTMLLEIPLPDDEAIPELSEAAKYLREAQEQLLHGKWRQAIAACRDVLESLSIALGDNKWKPPADLKRMLEVTKDMGKDERIRLMRWAMMPLTHAAKHADDITARIEWNMVDARAVITMTAAILQMAVAGGKGA